MIQEEQRYAIKNLIETGNIKQFKEIFLYIKKKHLHDQMGINYNRFLRIIKEPKRFQYEDAYQVARIFEVAPLKISELIHEQINYQSNEARNGKKPSR